MAPVTLQDIERSLNTTIKRWEYPLEHTEAAVAWRAWGDDVTIKNFVRQYAFDILKRQWADGELEIEYLRVDAVCALVEAMAKKPKSAKKTGPDLLHRALMRRTLEVHAVTTHP